MVLLLVSAALIAVLITYGNNDKNEPRNLEIQKPAVNRPAPIPGPFQQLAEEGRNQTRTTITVKKNETLGIVLVKAGLTLGQSHELTQAASKVMNLRRVKPGEKVIIVIDKATNQPAKVEYVRSPGDKVVIGKTPSGFIAAPMTAEPLMVLDAAEGEIKFSLWESAVEKHGLSAEVVMDLTDIFAYDIDFFTDVQPGDSYSLLYEKYFRQGRPVGSGRILYAGFVNKGRNLTAYWYSNKKGKGGYYNQKGGSLKKMFLKSPLRFSRISSRFSRSRFHPILKTYRPHLGIDYAAPAGTPVETVGEGRIIFIGRNGGYGKMIKIKHNRTYTTFYAHLSRFAKGLKRGKRVKQGDLIGYVGSTGLSTGPHLDFRMMKNNKFINPLAIKTTPAPPIPANEKQAFLRVVDRATENMAGLIQASD